ncbi:DUF6783 domain-containing protein [[Clostridium] symbiosum]|uniref:DUF6783 domain-containing protein n=1 Tax=Clostridium symbiosum TaxID=1512 RepID=UPI0009DC4684
MKIHSCHLHAPLCGIFGPNSVSVAHNASFIRAKSPAKCDAHLTESNFQPRSGERFGILMNDSIHGGNIFAGHGKL